ncbi:MAG: hypothetical protein R3C44_24415 [Chloroflexota bacterium]
MTNYNNLSPATRQLFRAGVFGITAGLVAIPMLILASVLLLAIVGTFTGRGASTRAQVSYTMFCSLMVIPVLFGVAYYFFTKQDREHKVLFIALLWLGLVGLAVLVITALALVVGPDQIGGLGFRWLVD